MNGLDAIRARDASDIGWTTADGMGMWVAQLRVDVRALLAEVDRLTTETVDAANDGYRSGGKRGYAEGVDAERARIRAAVEALPAGTDGLGPLDNGDPPPGIYLDRAAVLAAIEGAERPTPVRALMEKHGIPRPSEEEQQRRVDEYTRKPMREDVP